MRLIPNSGVLPPVTFCYRNKHNLYRTRMRNGTAFSQPRPGLDRPRTVNADNRDRLQSRITRPVFQVFQSFRQIARRGEYRQPAAFVHA